MTGALPDIGIRLSGGLEPRACIALAKAAEAAGLASVWFAENPFQRGVLATVGACAAATERVRIGVGVVNPFGRHPTLIAMEFAALDELAGGRAVLGIGSGIGAAVRRMGFADARPVSAVREAIAIIHAMLSGESVAHRGRVFGIEDVRPGFAARGVPIYMAAAGERALRACGEVADGLIISNLTPARSTARMVSFVAAAAMKAGRIKLWIVQYVPCLVRESGARHAIKATLGEMLTSFWPSGDDWPPAKERIVADSGIGRAEFGAALARLRRGDAADSVLDDRFVEAFAIAGTAEECLRQAVRYREAGVDELALTFAGGQAAKDIAYLGRTLAAWDAQ
jgi:5,10-methylenetetrahydromethanopterin reductase